MESSRHYDREQARCGSASPSACEHRACCVSCTSSRTHRSLVMASFPAQHLSLEVCVDINYFVTLPFAFCSSECLIMTKGQSDCVRRLAVPSAVRRPSHYDPQHSISTAFLPSCARRNHTVPLGSCCRTYFSLIILYSTCFASYSGTDTTVGRYC